MRAGAAGRTLDATDRPPLSMIFRFLRLALTARLRGDAKRSPFFGADRKPIVEPRVLSEDELRAVEKARDAA